MSVSLFTPYTVDRDWGTEEIIALTPTHVGKILRRKAGTKGGLQWHLKEECHYLLSGRLLLRQPNRDNQLVETVVEAGAAWCVSPGSVHQEQALTDCVILEVGDPTVDDRVRVEGDYGLPAGDSLPSMTPCARQEIARRLTRALRHRADMVEGMAAVLANQENPTVRAVQQTAAFTHAACGVRRDGTIGVIRDEDEDDDDD